MPTFAASHLQRIGEQLFTAGHVPPEIAREVTASLVLSNLLGVDSHGLVRIKNYFDFMKNGAIVPDAQPVVVRQQGCLTVMDGNKAFGQIAARRATEIAIEKCREHSIGVVSFTNICHIGRLGEWVSLAADQGFLGLMICNGGRPGGLVAPFGSRQRLLGTNPIAFALPSGSYPAVVADFSTAAAAEGRIRMALRKEQELPPNYIVDKEGSPSTNPADLYDGGAILCFGEHKGYALSLLVEVMGGILSGAETPIFPNYPILQNGVFLLVLDPTFFRPGAEYKQSVDFLFHAIKSGIPAQGSDGPLLPGEPDARRLAEREKNGVPIDDSTWTELGDLAHTLGLPWPLES